MIPQDYFDDDFESIIGFISDHYFVSSIIALADFTFYNGNQCNKANLYFQWNDYEYGNCIDKCLEGYYLDEFECKKCPLNCLTCDKDFCFTC